MARSRKKPANSEPAAAKPSKTQASREHAAVSFEHFEAQCQDSHKHLHRRDILVGDESQRVIIGLPLNAFSLQYLFHSTIYPLGRMAMLIGEPETCKTAFLFELMRWHLREKGGGSVYFLNESRDSPDLRESIIGKERERGVVMERCTSLEYWQTRLTRRIQEYEGYFRESGDCIFPVLFGLDSILGTASERTIEQILEDGHAKTSYAIEANLINIYTKFLFQRLSDWPFSFCCTNHIKYTQDKWGNKVPNTPGGVSLRYYSTFILHLRRLKDLDRLDIKGGRRLSLKTDKNSIGDSRKEITVEMNWWYENGQQLTRWDWHTATVELLMGFAGERRKQLDEILEFSNINKTSRLVSCPAVGVRKPLHYDEVGKAIFENDKIMHALRDYFGIKERRTLQPEVSYRNQVIDAIHAGDLQEKPTDKVKDDLPNEEDIPADEG